jgi:hypothetical protein
MNTDYILALARQAEDSVTSSRKLSDGQIERTFKPDDFYLKFAELLLQSVIKTATIYSGIEVQDCDYERGLLDGQCQILNSIKIAYGVEL